MTPAQTGVFFMKSSEYERSKEWIGCDLDGTLAHYEKWVDGAPIGEPVEPMLERVKGWLAEGKNVKIFTARVSDTRLEGFEEKAKVEAWCLKHLGVVLPVTCVKDCYLKQLWDDRAVGVVPNTGIPDAVNAMGNTIELCDKRLAQQQEIINRLEAEIEVLNAKLANV